MPRPITKLRHLYSTDSILRTIISACADSSALFFVTTSNNQKRLSRQTLLILATCSDVSVKIRWHGPCLDYGQEEKMKQKGASSDRAKIV
jgi:hypothetical protein